MANKSYAAFRRMFPNAKELERVMDKGCKGSVTELTKLAANMLHENAERAFAPNKWYLTQVKRSQVKERYKRRAAFVDLIRIQDKTVNLGGGFQNMAYFDEEYFDAFAYPKTHHTLGAYFSTDENEPVDLESYLSWMEYGTVNAYSDTPMERFERRGAKFMENTVKQLNKFLRGSGVDAIVSTEFGENSGVNITRYK